MYCCAVGHIPKTCSCVLYNECRCAVTSSPLLMIISHLYAFDYYHQSRQPFCLEPDPSVATHSKSYTLNQALAHFSHLYLSPLGQHSASFSHSASPFFSILRSPSGTLEHSGRITCSRASLLKFWSSKLAVKLAVKATKLPVFSHSPPIPLHFAHYSDTILTDLMLNL